MLTPEGKEKVASIVNTIKFFMLFIAMLASLWAAVASDATFLMLENFLSHLHVESANGINIRAHGGHQWTMEK